MVVVWGQGVLVTVFFPRPVIAEGIVRQAIAECFIGACFHDLFVRLYTRALE